MPFSISDEIASAMDWWREAGVDLDYADAPHRWIAPTEEPAPSPAAAIPATSAPNPQSVEAPAIGGGAKAWPGDLAAFQAWWLVEPALDGGRCEGRVPPRGPAQTPLMVLVAEPEAEDDDRLLSGPQGKLLDGFLRAAGIASESVYLASALVRHTPHPDWTDLSRSGVGDLVRHHVALVRPERLLVLSSPALSLISNGLAQTCARLNSFNHEDVSIPLLGSADLGTLLLRPRGKAALWRDWLNWTQA